MSFIEALYQRPRIQAITTWVEHGNTDPKTLTWHAKAEDIITKVRRGRTALTQVKSKTLH